MASSYGHGYQKHLQVKGVKLLPGMGDRRERDQDANPAHDPQPLGTAKLPRLSHKWEEWDSDLSKDSQHCLDSCRSYTDLCKQSRPCGPALGSSYPVADLSLSLLF